MIDFIKDSVEFLAFLGATLFFGFKLLSGFFVHNLSVSLKCQRCLIPDSDNDVLVVTAELAKGDISALTLHDIQARVSYGDYSESISFHGFLRCSFTTQDVGSTSRKVAKIEHLSDSAPLLNLAPGEEACFSCSVEVPTNKTVTVELTVLGKRAYVGKGVGQWRSSTVIPPIA